ncbi:MAG: DNA (cytosine-5-)-methyltransferase [Pseudomonadota bacterium]
MMTFGSLFAGIGGLDLGLERAGMTCAWQVEIDEWCRQVLAKHWPDVRRYEDVRDCGAENLEPVDLICGGFPCQPHSVAGKHRGINDDRNLWPEMCRVIDELKPTWVLAENVPGIRTTILDQVLTDLEAMGYEVGILGIPAVAFDAPHRRQRVWIVAYTARDEWKESKAGDGREVPTRRSAEGRQSFIWKSEPAVGRVANGIPRQVDRLRGLGNAVVPQVAEWIGRHIVEVQNEQTGDTDQN